MKIDKEAVIERLIELRKICSPQGASDFARKINFKQPTYARYEKGDNIVSAELVQALMFYLNVNPHWFFFGKGEMFLKPEQTLERKTPDGDAEYWLHKVGERVLKVQKFFGYSDEKMANILDVSPIEYIDLITKNRFPKGKTIKILNSFKDNFRGVTVDELLYDDTNTFDTRLNKGEKVEIDLSTLSPEKALQLKNLLKEI